MPNQNLAYDQRVLCIALRKMTKDTTLIRSGFLHWNNTLADKEFDVDSVVKELVDYLGISVNEKKTLMLTLHAASSKLFDELPPVPAVLLNMLNQSANIEAGGSQDELSSAQNTAGVIAAKSPHWVITDQSLQYLVLYLGKHSKNDLAELKTILVEEGVADTRKELSKAIKQWASTGFVRTDLPDDISEDECYEVTHGIYMLMSEVIGPVEADRIINRVIDEALKLDVASRFSPKNLL